jgi:hypothetical protein
VSVEPKRVTGAQYTAKRLYSRAKLLSEAYVKQADLSAVRVVVKNLDNATTYSATGISPSAVVSDTLQPWDEDAVGYNFAATVPAAAFAGTGEHNVVYLATPTGGDEFPIAWFKVDVRPLGSVA